MPHRPKQSVGGRNSLAIIKSKIFFSPLGKFALYLHPIKEGYMTTEKFNELKETVEKAGECTTVRIYVNGLYIISVTPLGGIEFFNEDLTYIQVPDSRMIPTSKLVFLDDVENLEYEFVCNATDEGVTFVKYCNGTIKTERFKV